MALQESGEMYLETILVLSMEKGTVRAIDICDYMGYSKPSVSRAVGILKEDGYISVDSNNYLTLTEKGLEIATKIYERHTVLTKVFVGMGIDPEIASEDACKIEHVISPETFAAMKKLISKDE